MASAVRASALSVTAGRAQDTCADLRRTRLAVVLRSRDAPSGPDAGCLLDPALLSGARIAIA
jgi:hypothetical protein